MTQPRKQPGPRYRSAREGDIAALMEIRNTVRENALVSTVLTHADYLQAMFSDGQAWVCEVDDELIGFSCARRRQGDIWALFLRQSHEGRGIGSALLERAETWMFEQGLERIWLVTAPGTRAERLYRRRGWVEQGLKPTGDLEFILDRSHAPR